MKLIYLVVFYYYHHYWNLSLFIHPKIEKNKGKRKTKENLLKKQKKLHDLSRDVHSDNYEISRAQAHMTFP